MQAMVASADGNLKGLRVPADLRPVAGEIVAIADRFCVERLDAEYAELGRRLVARLARKRPSPLVRGDTRIWAAGSIYAVGQINFLFDPSELPHLSADQLATHLGVVKSSMANKATLIRKTLDLGVYEPDLTRRSMLERHPLTWLVQVNGFLVDARTLPAEIQDEARRRGLIPDLDERRAA